MVEENTNSQLLIEGIAAARAGETDDARRLLRRVTELDPDNVEAWLWRANVADNTADKKAYLEEALSLDPSNQEAQLALQRVVQREGEVTARVDDEPLFCTVHPDRETMLRCNRCGRAMCTDCAVRHPVGMRCRECVRQTRSPIYQVSTGVTAKAFFAATIISMIVGLLVFLFGGILLGFGIFGLIIAFFLAGAVGRAIGEAVQRAVPRKRGQAMQVAAGAGVLLGTLIAGFGLALVIGGFNIILAGIYLIAAVPAVASTFR